VHVHPVHPLYGYAYGRHYVFWSSVRPSVRPLPPIFCVTRYLCRLLSGWISVELAVVITENIFKVRGQGRMWKFLKLRREFV